MCLVAKLPDTADCGGLVKSTRLLCYKRCDGSSQDYGQTADTGQGGGQGENRVWYVIKYDPRLPGSCPTPETGTRG